MKKELRKNKIVVGSDRKPYLMLWRELKALEILKELYETTLDLDISLYKVGQEMVKRGYTKDPRYIYKRLWYLRQEPKPPISEGWKEYFRKRQKYVDISD